MNDTGWDEKTVAHRGLDFVQTFLDLATAQFLLEALSVEIPLQTGIDECPRFRMQYQPGLRLAQVGRIEMHETMRSGKISSMRPIARVAVRDGETLAFEPGGRHLMIYDLDPGATAGEQIDLVLHFERGEDDTLSAEIVPAGGDVGH